LTFLGHVVMWQGPSVQNLTHCFDFRPPHCLFTMILLGGFEEDLRVFTGETANAKVKSSENFLSPDPILVVFGGWGQMVQNVSIFTPKGTCLSESASFKPFCMMIGWGVWPPGVFLKKTAESHRTSHWSDVLPLTWLAFSCSLWYLVISEAQKHRMTIASDHQHTWYMIHRIDWYDNHYCL